MRHGTKWSSVQKEAILNTLLDCKNDPERYRNAMYQLGRALGGDIANAFSSARSDIYVACTVEDADFLAKGILDVLEDTRSFKAIHFACFWNERKQLGQFEIAPILKKYKEPSSAECQTLVIVKSIISGACVVKTNLTSMISELQPTNILVVAPVILEGAEMRLKREFPEAISDKFEFVTYAVDDEKLEDNVVPGIGGNVYELLGYGGEADKNAYIPEIVRSRRARFAAT